MRRLISTFVSVVFCLGLMSPVVFGADKPATAPAKKQETKKAIAAPVGLVDINTATKDDLKAIPGIGDVYSQKIIDGRPYTNKTQLKTKGKIPANVYEKIKDKVTAKQAK